MADGGRRSKRLVISLTDDEHKAISTASGGASSISTWAREYLLTGAKICDITTERKKLLTKNRPRKERYKRKPGLEFEYLLSETERGCALMAAEHLSSALSDLIAARFECDSLIHHKDISHLLDGHRAPLGSFSTRADFSYALGLISADVWESLRLIREMRNRFAHSTGPEYFEEAEVHAAYAPIKHRFVGAKLRGVSLSFLVTEINLKLDMITNEHISASAKLYFAVVQMLNLTINERISELTHSITLDEP